MGTPRGVITDVDGSYEITVEGSEELEFSFIGMVSQTVKVAGQQRIVLEQTQELENITVVAFGKQKKESVIMPMYFTLDMGKEASYSRFRYWMTNRQPIWSGRIFTRFEVWATNSPRPLNTIGDGSRGANLNYWTAWPEVGGTDEWKNDWVKLVDGEVKLPSGEDDPALITEEDREFIQAGFEFEMDPQYGDQQFRYLRFVVKETNIGVPHFMVSEMKFWGAYKN